MKVANPALPGFYEDLVPERVFQAGQDLIHNLQRTVEQDFVEVVKSVPQNRISEWMSKQNWVEAPRISCQESVEVDKTILQERIF